MLLQGFKDLVEKCHSEKILNIEHKKNAEKLQLIRQNKLSGMLASNAEIVSTIEGIHLLLSLILSLFIWSM